MSLTTKEAAALLGVSQRRVRKMIKDKRLKARRSGRDWRIQESEIAEVSERKRGPGRPKKGDSK